MTLDWAAHMREMQPQVMAAVSKVMTPDPQPSV